MGEEQHAILITDCLKEEGPISALFTSEML